MKISASIYSDKNRTLREVVEDLVSHQVDMLHVDCNDEPAVFEDIAYIRTLCDLPIDLHIITDNPAKYFDLLRQTPVEYVTFQYENLTEALEVPSDITGRKGLAIITPTEVSVFDKFPNFDFILIMATIPGQSGGVFDKVNFAKIRKFRKLYPSKSIHVDGGVNGEVSFILRNMGVTSSVSGSYLFNAPSIGHALMNLTKREIESHFHIKDFMIPISEGPRITESDLTLITCLQTIENGELGFCVVTDQDDNFKGLVSNADIRKGLLNELKSNNSIEAMDVKNLINRNPVLLNEEMTVLDMLRLIKKSSFPITYLPVVNTSGKATGIVNFVNLIKGEL